MISATHLQWYQQHSHRDIGDSATVISVTNPHWYQWLTHSDVVKAQHSHVETGQSQPRQCHTVPHVGPPATVQCEQTSADPHIATATLLLFTAVSFSCHLLLIWIRLIKAKLKQKSQILGQACVGWWTSFFFFFFFVIMTNKNFIKVHAKCMCLCMHMCECVSVWCVCVMCVCVWKPWMEQHK